MAARDPKTPGATFSEKNVLFFLEFIEPVTPLWVLYPSEIMHVGFPQPPLARAVFTRSIRELGCQPGAPKPREHDFPKKKTSFFFEIHRTSDTSMGSVVLYPSEIMQMDSTEPLLATAVFTRSNKVPGWQPGAPKFREHDLPKKILIF